MHYKDYTNNRQVLRIVLLSSDMIQNEVLLFNNA